MMTKIRFTASEASSKNQWAVKKKKRNYETLQIFWKKKFRRRLTKHSSSRNGMHKKLTFDSYITVSCGLETHFEYHTSFGENQDIFYTLLIPSYYIDCKTNFMCNVRVISQYIFRDKFSGGSSICTAYWVYSLFQCKLRSPGDWFKYFWLRKRDDAYTSSILPWYIDSNLLCK